MKKNIQNDFEWVIHCIKNGSKCAVCSEPINDMMPGSANYHTHGMKKYKHPDFQLVLNYDMQVAGYILNTLADRVRSGERFKDGEYVKGIFLDCDVRLDTFVEDGRKVLRVIVPDKYNIFPNEMGCDMKYWVQLIETDKLYANWGEKSQPCRCRRGA